MKNLSESRNDNDIRDLKNLADRLQQSGFSWQHEDYFLLKRLLPKLIANVGVDFPILRIIDDDHLKSGAKIERCQPILSRQDDYVCLIRADGEIIASGENLKDMLMEAVFVLC